MSLVNVTIWCLSSKLDQCSNGATLKRKIPDMIMKPLFWALLSGSACWTQARLAPQFKFKCNPDKCNTHEHFIFFKKKRRIFILFHFLNRSCNLITCSSAMPVADCSVLLLAERKTGWSNTVQHFRGPVQNTLSLSLNRLKHS